MLLWVFSDELASLLLHPRRDALADTLDLCLADKPGDENALFMARALFG